MASSTKGTAAYKKKDGTLSITEDEESLQWLPLGASIDKAVKIAVADITSMFFEALGKALFN